MGKPPVDLRARGSRHGAAKLTEDDVREIRWRFFESGETFAALAHAFSVSESCVGLVLHRRTWGHVE
jgi:hypothetical protein